MKNAGLSIADTTQFYQLFHIVLRTEGVKSMLYTFFMVLVNAVFLELQFQQFCRYLNRNQ